MADFKAYWYDEAQSILMWEYPPEYTLQDLATIGAQVRHMLTEQAGPRVDIVMVMNNANATGNNMLTMLNGAYDTMPPHVKSLVFVAPSSFAKLIIKMLNQLHDKARSTTHMVTTIEEALAKIESLRTSDAPADTATLNPGT